MRHPSCATFRAPTLIRRTAASASRVLGLGLLLLVQGCADSAVDPGTPIQPDLITLANAALNEKNAALVSGSPPRNSLRSELYAGAVRDDLSEITSRRALLLQAGLRFTAFTTTLEVQKSDVRQNEATLSASEHTILSLVVESASGVPPTTEYVQDHVFRFSKRNGTWYLVEDELVNTLQSKDPLTDTMHLDPAILPTMEANGEFHLVTPASNVSIPAASAAASGEYVSKAAVVAYAYKYWRNYNSSYRRYDKDCTNFVSQAMRQGGWKQVGGAALYRYVTVWFYDSLVQSWTWVNANSWFAFVNSRPRGRFVSDVRQLVPGDVVQADWNLDGIVDHSMIVTKKDSKGNLYLTYHSNDAVDRPLADIRASAPRAAIYGWSLYGS